jgi:hypothetical protein
MSGQGDCPNSPEKPPFNGHRGEFELGVFDKNDPTRPQYPDPGDPRWPKTCKRCNQTLVTSKDSGGMTGLPHYRREDTGQIITSPLPPGAMFYYDDAGPPFGPDGRCLVVCLPPDGHWWYVDSIASNCTVPCKCGHPYVSHHRWSDPNPIPCKKFEPIDGRKHRCWVRSGTPPLVHVGKEGETCGAGSGSIQTSNWHGFLTHGMLQLNR